MNEVTKPGYKHTELGWIPEDWGVKNLNDIGFFKKGKGIKKDQVSIDGVGCVRYGELYTQYDSVIRETKSKIPKTLIPETQKIEKGDLLFAGSGETKEEIGKCAAYLGVNESYAGGDIIIFTPKTDDSIFLGYLLNQSLISKQKAQYGQGDAVVHIYSSGLGKVKIPLPPLPEQTAIATALSDMDSYIQSLEALIAKKRLIKQGAMQELLTPKEDWEVRKLGELAFIEMGQSPLSEYYNSKSIGLPLIQGNADIESRKTIIRNYTSQITKRGKVGDVIMSVRAPVGEISKATFDCCLGRGVCAIRYQNDYLYHYLIFIEKAWSQFSTGSTFDSVNSQQIKELEIPIPRKLKEQLNISDVLNSIDFELESLELKLIKGLEIKQGMMQELLTGRTRLV